ncbi:MAG: acyl-[acyl-carrier-protein]--UDP-N-acetylglucosamine O-acyltransferase [Bacteroidetes bacterium HGW-Bacteroidetes-1]|nr:MAG: acyl-[acyl-carrier-protein]--UDP-N-acetylglucosamine O-acyltransferase [Bacteroidetes bacterium HGW-Bacteroidetes-1]
MISPRAEIHPDAILGENVVVEAFAKIDKDVIIGKGTWIGANVTLYPGTRIGSNCKVFPGAVIAAEPQDMKFMGEYSTVEIGNFTTIREYVTINRGTASKGVTKVGNHCLLMAYTHLGHDVEVGNHCVIVNSVQIAGEVVIEDWAVIGGMSAVHQFCRIGQHAMVSGMTGVLSDVLPFTKVIGMPANYMGINYLGLKRRGFGKDKIDSIHDVYRVLYQNGFNTTQAIEYIRMYLDPSEETDQIITFIKNSKRGFVKGIISDVSRNVAVNAEA